MNSPLTNNRPTVGKLLRAATLCLSSDGGIDVARQRLETGLAEAAGDGVDLVCLPESAFWPTFDCSAAEGADGETAAYYAALAERHRLHLLAPLLLREKSRLYNAMLWFAPSGELVWSYRKCHPTPLETERGISPGPLSFQPHDSPWGVMGCAICLDINYHDVMERLAAQSVRLILFPTMFQGLALMRAWARMNRCYIMSAASVQYGCLVDPLGRTPIAPWAHDDLMTADIPFDYEVVTTTYANRFPGIRRKYGRQVIIDRLELESSALLASLHPEKSAQDILAEFDIPTEIDELALC